jgi:hypothetical protein
MHRSPHFRWSVCLAVALTIEIGSALAGTPKTACQIQVVDSDSGWPVPMVTLETTSSVKFVTDNAGRVAFDAPEFMGQETWLSVSSDGYELPADGFGKRGVRLQMDAGSSFTIKVNRTSIAKRLGRLTGAGTFDESEKLGLENTVIQSGITGCDSVQNSVHNGKMFWAWGDTSIPQYDLGIFDSTGAMTEVRPLTTFEPPLRVKFDHFHDSNGKPRGIAKMPGPGPTWLTGVISLPDKDGKDHLVAMYLKSKPPMEGYEAGLCVWNEQKSEFEHRQTIWTKSQAAAKHPPMPGGHGITMTDEQGKKWALFGDPLPTLKCAATYEAWQNRESWQVLQPQDGLIAAGTGQPVKPASGSIAWNAFRHRWVTVFMQVFGRPSGFGEVWYAEADSPFGPWGPAVKVLSHKNYSFYNPALHPEFTPPDSPILLFEGTHSTTFADHAEPTPRYEYNQILYRLDLDDPKLAPARERSK